MNKLQVLKNLCSFGVSVTMNEHRLYEASLEEYLEDHSAAVSINVDNAILETMIQRDEIVEVLFYPRDHVVWHKVYHYDLDEALTAALRLYKEIYGDGDEAIARAKESEKDNNRADMIFEGPSSSMIIRMNQNVDNEFHGNGEVISQPDELYVKIYGAGLTYVCACSELSPEDTQVLVNRRHPGIGIPPLVYHKQPEFENGQQCKHHPKRRHYLFVRYEQKINRGNY